jgi:tetratricopeptide (TPR) repeat protein
MLSSRTAALALFMPWAVSGTPTWAQGADLDALAEKMAKAQVLVAEKKNVEAMAALEEVRALAEQADLPPDHQLWAHIHGFRGEVFRREGLYEQAEPDLRKALRIFQLEAGPDDPAVALTAFNLIQVLALLGRKEESLALARERLRVSRELFGSDDLSVAAMQRIIGDLEMQLGNPAQGLAAYRESQAVFEQHLGPDHPQVVELRTRTAAAEAALGR